MLVYLAEVAGWLAGIVVAGMALLSRRRPKEEPTPPGNPFEQLRETLSQLRASVASESSEGLRLVEDLGDNPLCTVSVDESIPAVVVTWRRDVTSAQLRFIHEAVLEVIRSRGLSLILGDDTELPTIHTEDQRWIIEDWIPRARAAGVRAAASKSPAACFGRLAVKQIGSYVPWKLRVFDDMPEARHWLQTQAH